MDEGGGFLGSLTSSLLGWWGIVAYSWYVWFCIGAWIGIPLSLWYIWRDRHWSYLAAVIFSIADVALAGGPKSEYEVSKYAEATITRLGMDFLMGVMVIAAFRHARKGAIFGLLLHLILVALCLFSLYESSTLQKQLENFVFVAIRAGVWSIVLCALVEVMVRRIKSIKVSRVDTRNISIVNAYAMDGYRIHLSFSDGHESTVAFGPFLSTSGHPDVQKYLDMKTFRQFTVRKGDLMWGDYDMIFPVADLYAGRVS